MSETKDSVYSVLKPWTGECREFEGMPPKQRLFVEHLLAEPDFNMTEAARKAGYKNPAASACKLIKIELVRKLLARKMDQRVKELKLDPERVILELARIGLLDPRKMLDEQGQLLPLKAMDQDTAAAISSIKVSKRIIPGGPDAEDEIEQTTEVRFHSKIDALEMLAKHLGILKELAPQMTLVVGPEFWDGLAARVAQSQEDSVEKRIAEIQLSSMQGPDCSAGKEEKPPLNGHLNGHLNGEA